MIDVTALADAYVLCCPKCDYDEAEGALIDHCDECCRRFTTAIHQHLPTLMEVAKRAGQLDRLINTPELHDFLEGVRLEAAHQIDRWGTAHDRGKRPADWFWLVGYLAGKALHADTGGDREKALHHCISTAAALRNWHAAIAGTDKRMAPGSSDVAQIVEHAFPGETKT